MLPYLGSAHPIPISSFLKRVGLSLELYFTVDVSSEIFFLLLSLSKQRCVLGGVGGKNSNASFKVGRSKSGVLTIAITKIHIKMKKYFGIAKDNRKVRYSLKGF